MTSEPARKRQRTEPTPPRYAAFTTSDMEGYTLTTRFNATSTPKGDAILKMFATLFEARDPDSEKVQRVIYTVMNAIEARSQEDDSAINDVDRTVINASPNIEFPWEYTPEDWGTWELFEDDDIPPIFGIHYFYMCWWT